MITVRRLLYILIFVMLSVVFFTDSVTTDSLFGRSDLVSTNAPPDQSNSSQVTATNTPTCIVPGVGNFCTPTPGGPTLTPTPTAIPTDTPVPGVTPTNTPTCIVPGVGNFCTPTPGGPTLTPTPTTIPVDTPVPGATNTPTCNVPGVGNFCTPTPTVVSTVTNTPTVTPTPGIQDKFIWLPIVFK